MPGVRGAGKRSLETVEAQPLLEYPEEVIQGERVLPLRFRVRRETAPSA
ncbi:MULTISPECIES: hypothetical protein [Actinomycetes]